MFTKLTEAKDLEIQKRLLYLFGEYSSEVPATGASALFSKLVKNGLSGMPKDKRALAILSKVVKSDKSIPAKIQEILNLRFSGLPIEVRPIYKNGNMKEVAFWERGGKIYDQVISLIDFDGKTRSGSWVDARGHKVDLIDMVLKKDGGDNKITTPVNDGRLA